MTTPITGKQASGSAKEEGELSTSDDDVSFLSLFLILRISIIPLSDPPILTFRCNRARELLSLNMSLLLRPTLTSKGVFNLVKTTRRFLFVACKTTRLLKVAFETSLLVLFVTCQEKLNLCLRSQRCLLLPYKGRNFL